MRPCFIPGGMWGCGVAGELHRMHALLHTPDLPVSEKTIQPKKVRMRLITPKPPTFYLKNKLNRSLC